MWPNSKTAADLVTFTEEVCNGNLHFSCSVCYLIQINLHENDFSEYVFS